MQQRMIQGVPYNEYMRNYMANKRRRVDAVIIPPINPVIQPVYALIIQKKPKHFTIRPNYYYFMKHNKMLQNVLKQLICKVHHLCVGCNHPLSEKRCSYCRVDRKFVIDMLKKKTS